MRFLLTLALIAAPLAAAGGDAKVWSTGELDQTAARLSKNLNEQHYQLERLGDFGNHYVLLVHREGNGPAEIHDEWTDFYVVREGTATLQVGGKLEGGGESEPGEMRGKSLSGAKATKLKPGDTVNIPPKTPHQIVLAPGEKLTYLIVKVKAAE